VGAVNEWVTEFDVVPYEDTRIKTWDELGVRLVLWKPEG
jgi:hypothetical protein